MVPRSADKKKFAPLHAYRRRPKDASTKMRTRGASPSTFTLTLPIDRAIAIPIMFMRHVSCAAARVLTSMPHHCPNVRQRQH